MTSERKIIVTSAVPAAVGPYSQAVVAGGLIYTAGMLPIDMASGLLVSGGIAEQTKQVLDHLKALLEASGSSMSRVVKATVFMTDLGEFGEMNAIYASYFPQDPPARSTFQVAALPKGAKIEMEMVALQS